jgi:hypothetical protein
VSVQLHPQGRSPWYPLDRRLSGPQSRSGRGGEEKKSQPGVYLKPLYQLNILQCQLKGDDDRVWFEGKDLKGCDHGVFGGIFLEFPGNHENILSGYWELAVELHSS